MPPELEEQIETCPKGCETHGKKSRLVALLIHPESGSFVKVGVTCRQCHFVRWSDGSETSLKPGDDEATSKVWNETEGMVLAGVMILKKNPRAYARLWHYLAKQVVDADQYLFDAAGGSQRNDEPGGK